MSRQRAKATEAAPPSDPSEALRVDRWLCVARLFKSRTLAQEACEAGHVRVNGVSVKPSHALRPGDEVRAQAPRGLVVAVVRALAGKRQSAALAKTLYEDRSPPPAPRDERVARRPRGAGRPTKAERRATERLRRES